MADLDAVNLGLDEDEANMTAHIEDRLGKSSTAPTVAAAVESESVQHQRSSTGSSDSSDSSSSSSSSSTSTSSSEAAVASSKQRRQRGSASSGNGVSLVAAAVAASVSSNAAAAAAAAAASKKRSHSPGNGGVLDAKKNRIQPPQPPIISAGGADIRPKLASAIAPAAAAVAAAAAAAVGPKSGQPAKSVRDTYDYATKLNYFFRETRFFLIKSSNVDNVDLSKEQGVWSTLPQNEANLNQAFRESRNVILVFSVKESGRFAGFARMHSESRRDVAPVDWLLPPGLSSKVLGGVIRVDWLCKRELPFSATSHLYNAWNEGKPVKIGRDGQEIEGKTGAELCRLFDEDTALDLMPILKRSKDKARQLREQGISAPARMPVPAQLAGRLGVVVGGPGRGLGAGPSGGQRPTPGGDGRRAPLFLTSRSKMQAAGGAFKRGASSPPPFGGHRSGPNGGGGGGQPQHWDRQYSSPAAAAEAYVADYMRTMQHQLPPMPYAPPPGYMSGPFDGPHASNSNGGGPAARFYDPMSMVAAAAAAAANGGGGEFGAQDFNGALAAYMEEFWNSDRGAATARAMANSAQSYGGGDAYGTHNQRGHRDHNNGGGGGGGGGSGRSRHSDYRDRRGNSSSSSYASQRNHNGRR